MGAAGKGRRKDRKPAKQKPARAGFLSHIGLSDAAFYMKDPKIEPPMAAPSTAPNIPPTVAIVTCSLVEIMLASCGRSACVGDHHCGGVTKQRRKLPCSRLGGNFLVRRLIIRDRQNSRICVG
jgi:hypothetical protein